MGMEEGCRHAEGVIPSGMVRKFYRDRSVRLLMFGLMSPGVAQRMPVAYAQIGPPLTTEGERSPGNGR
jgi:hypothetical protein